MAHYGAGGEEEEASDRDSDGSEKATTQMDPLELRFSQRKMRNVFADGKLIAESVDQVRPIRRSAEDANIYGAEWRLEAPFPPIEVIRFRCKLRDENTGRPLIDPVTKEDRFEAEESWFTLDNRRLYCLQRAAIQLLPERCTVDAVAEIRKERRLREIRKFRTLDNGKSIEVGSVVDGVPFATWCWMSEAQQATATDSKPKGGGKGGKGKSNQAGGGGKGKGGGRGNAGSENAPSGKGTEGKSKGGGKGKGEAVYWQGAAWQDPWSKGGGYGGWDDYNYGGPFGYFDFAGYGQGAPVYNPQGGSKGKGGGKKGKGNRSKGGEVPQQWW